MRPLIKDLNALYFTLHHGIRTYYLHRLKHQSSDIIVTKHMIYISLNLVRNVILLYESFSRSNAMIFMIYLLLCYFTLMSSSTICHFFTCIYRRIFAFWSTSLPLLPPFATPFSRLFPALNPFLLHASFSLMDNRCLSIMDLKSSRSLMY